MQVSRLSARVILLLLLLTFLSVTIARADDDDEPDDYDVKARVVRVSLMVGEVSLKRNDSKDWELVRLNYPLVEGDTVATGKDSRLELQFDSRNFVRLAPNSVLRIVTLRDEGTALSVTEGTVTFRIAKLDRNREFFEIDAPRSTLAVEKTGLYRVDAPGTGRIRLTVRDGGSARIYSDTSGFTLRDGRSAELVVSGENAGDWDLLAAAPRDAIDQWVDDRERYLAQRFRYEAKYFDEDVWGAEDLDAYGDWTNSKEYGWIWRPHASVINVYTDWAPYRYGSWTWCPPYGWTWVGYEPWGWAPYHYGRWVYYNGYWAWVPRSHFYKKRSWWRPALVAFVNFTFSFGDNICWYPLSYYQRDPHSRYYRRHGYGGGGGYSGGRGGGGGGGYPGGGRGGDGRDGRGRGDGDGGERRYGPQAEYKSWHGVTRVPRTNFGREPGRPVEEPIARRVLESEPEITNLPRRTGTAGSVPLADSETPESRGRRPLPAVVERPTGAGNREPGAPLDDDLRRSRVYRGREPRATQPAQPTQSTPTPVETNNAPGRRNAPVEGAPPVATEAPPSGAVERPEPRPGSTRIVRPPMPGQIKNPEVIDSPAPRSERRSEPRSEPRVESPPEPRSEPRIEPRSEPRPEPRPEPRSEPRSEEPRVERPTQRYERPEPPPQRTESPRNDPPARSEPPPRHDPPPRSEPAPRNDPPPRHDPPPRNDPPPRSEPAPRNDPPPRSESPRSESPRSESPRPDPGPRRPDNLRGGFDS